MDRDQQRLHDILDSDEVTRINFRAGSIWVAGAGFSRVRRALRENQMSVQYAPFRIPATQCAYYPARNILAYGSGLSFSNTFDQALFVHEATHAWQDFLNRPMTILDAEVAAYIAQGFYLVAKGMPSDEVATASSSASSTGVVNQILLDAYDAAKDVYEQSGGYRVPEDAAEFVRESIMDDRANYRNADTTSAPFNGR